jgi:uncharacterized protein YjbJ (UPF0337 family)
MTDDRTAGTVRNFGGKSQKEAASAVGAAATEAEGMMNQAAGAIQDAYGKTVDTAIEGAQTVKDAAVAGHDYIKKFVEDNPHTATLIALGIGVLVGYAAHRPPPRRRWWD